MDGLIGFVILLIIASLLERFLKGQRARRPPLTDEELEAGEPGVEGDRPRASSLQELIAEELGLNLERRPQVRRTPDPSAAPGGGPQAAPRVKEVSADAMAGGERVVYYPSPREPGVVTGRETTSERGERAARERRESVDRESRVAPRRRLAESRERRRRVSVREARESKAPVSPEELGLRQRGEAASLEQVRRPEDHDRFHDRYGVPQPVGTHQEFHARYVRPLRAAGQGRSGPRLPDDPDWSGVQKAIVWAEVLGPPKGLVE